MDYLRYDTEIMESVKDVYKDCCEKMGNIKDKMQAMVVEVRSGWESEAGDAFFTKYNDVWLSGFTHYMEVLEHMAENLDSAIGRYSEITREANSLKLNV